MALLQLVPHNTKIDFIGKRFISFTITALIIIISSISLMTKGLHYGIDFKGGLILDVRMPDAIDVSKMRNNLNALGVGEVTLQVSDNHKDMMIRLEQPDEEKEADVLTAVKQTLGDQVDYRRVDKIGPKVGEELIKNSVKAIVIALIVMLIYIAFRFEWQFAMCAVFALFHDCFAVLALFSLFPMEFNETAIIAILLTAGYSINDTIVIFDRIRENLGRYPNLPLANILNMSINETLSRTMLTVTTTLLALVALFFFGGKIIAAFSLPILLGVIIGSFSSICLASPLLMYLKLKPKGQTAVNI